MDPHRYNRHSICLEKDNFDNEDSVTPDLLSVVSLCTVMFLGYSSRSDLSPRQHSDRPEDIEPHTEEDVGLLVQVGFDITAFRPPAYQRGSLPRPLKMSHLEDGFALRCFQRLS